MRPKPTLNRTRRPGLRFLVPCAPVAAPVRVVSLGRPEQRATIVTTLRAKIMAGIIVRLGRETSRATVEHPSKFDLVINLKTAKALGLLIPQSLLLQANDVIE